MLSRLLQLPQSDMGCLTQEERLQKQKAPLELAPADAPFDPVDALFASRGIRSLRRCAGHLFPFLDRHRIERPGQFAFRHFKDAHLAVMAGGEKQARPGMILQGEHRALVFFQGGDARAVAGLIDPDFAFDVARGEVIAVRAVSNRANRVGLRSPGRAGVAGGHHPRHSRGEGLCPGTARDRAVRPGEPA